MQAEPFEAPIWNRCRECGTELVGYSFSKQYCSNRCKRLWRKKNSSGNVKKHICRECGKEFDITKGQYNKWLCSDDCRKKRNARRVREFHLRRPRAEAAYRAKAKEKRLPNDNLTRFRRTNPNAPIACESCGETRVLDVAHKPGHERFGRGRRSDLVKWPDQVWVLCPTCHALHDRMHYSPEELGLTV